jgi:hypothetical protein
MTEQIFTDKDVIDDEPDDWVVDEFFEDEDYTDVPLEIGSLVVCDNQKLPLRSSSQWYKYAVVISVDPFVLISPDGTMRWDNFPIHELRNIGVVETKTLRHCNTRFLNDKDVIAYDKEVTERNATEQNSCRYDLDEKTSKEVYEYLQQFMVLDANLWKPRLDYVITVDGGMVTTMSYGLGTVCFEGTAPLPLRLLQDSMFKNKLRVFHMVYAKTT